jgi:hypothetical protein
MQEGQLNPAIAVSEWMNGVEITQKCGGPCEKDRVFYTREERRRLETREQQFHLPSYVLWKAEPISALCRANGSVAASPRVDIAKQVPVDAPIGGRPKTARRQRVCRAQARHFEFEGLQNVRITETQAVLQTV